MISVNQQHVSRLTKEIADLRKAEAQETRKEANIHAAINRANEAAHRTRSISTLTSKMKEAERGSQALAIVQKKRAEISRKIADKSKMLFSYEERQAREDEKERKRIANEQNQLIRKRREYESRVTNEIQHRANLMRTSALNIHTRESCDCFIAHASEDKDGFVRGLAKALQDRGVRVWYDEFTLKVGDSIRREIDKGLADSRFGIVVLSRHFFEKDWPQRELDALSSLEASGNTRILPIWHEISKDELVRHSPLLSDKLALNTSISSTEEIADELCKLIK